LSANDAIKINAQENIYLHGINAFSTSQFIDYMMNPKVLDVWHLFTDGMFTTVKFWIYKGYT